METHYFCRVIVNVDASWTPGPYLLARLQREHTAQAMSARFPCQGVARCTSWPCTNFAHRVSPLQLPSPIFGGAGKQRDQEGSQGQIPNLLTLCLQAGLKHSSTSSLLQVPDWESGVYSLQPPHSRSLHQFSVDFSQKKRPPRPKI